MLVPWRVTRDFFYKPLNKDPPIAAISMMEDCSIKVFFYQKTHCLEGSCTCRMVDWLCVLFFSDSPFGLKNKLLIADQATFWGNNKMYGNFVGFLSQIVHCFRGI